MRNTRTGRIWRTAFLAAALLGAVGGAEVMAQTRPTCSVVVPSANQTVSGAVILSAAATNAVQVDYYLDGLYLGAAVPTIYGWIYTWDSPTVSNGTHAITCVATSSTGLTGKSSKRNVTLANPVGCNVLLPTGDSPVYGTATALDAVPTIANPTQVELYLHTPSAATVPLGVAVPTIYGYLYSPDGGQSFGWDSTPFADGVYSLSCVATAAGGTRTTSASVSFTLDNSTSHVWPSVCLGHVPASASDYQAAFDHRSGGWAGADGAGNIPLPDGRQLWLFGDTFVGGVDANNALLPGWLFPRNSVQVQSRHCFTPLLKGTPSSPSPDSFFPDPDADHWFWPSGGFADTGATPDVVRVVATRLKTLPRTCGSGTCSASQPTCPAGKVCNLANNVCNSSAASCTTDSQCTIPGETCLPGAGWNWTLEGMNIITLSLPSLAVTSVAPIPSDGIAGTKLFGTSSVWRAGSYVYLYGGDASGQYVARAPAGNFMNGTWRYWAGGTSWSTDPTLAQPMVVAPGSPDAELPPVNVVKYGSGYLATGKLGLEGFVTSIVKGWYSKQPYGPWHEITANGAAVQIVPPLSYPNRFFYGGRAMVDAPGSSTAAPIMVFSTNSDALGENVLLYGPQFVAPADLPSPAELAALYPDG